MSKFATLYSGSSGNCTYIGGSRGGILIDAGVSAKAIVTGLSSIGSDISEVEAIFVTHEHGDHIRGITVLCAKHGIPVYATGGTLSGMGVTGHEPYLCSEMNGAVEAAGMEISNFSTLHDTRESCGYRVKTADGRIVAVCTDLGLITDEVKAALTGADLVMLESNHDIMMLQNGPYPYPLKRRVMSDTGHLSNAVCADILPELLQSGATRFMLAHLSKENNFPQLALETSKSTLTLSGFTAGKDYILEVAAPSVPKVLVL